MPLCKRTGGIRWLPAFTTIRRGIVNLNNGVLLLVKKNGIRGQAVYRENSCITDGAICTIGFTTTIACIFFLR